jgi:hypothetical protein
VKCLLKLHISCLLLDFEVCIWHVFVGSVRTFELVMEMATPFGLVAQAISHRPLTAETWLTPQIRSCGICSGQSGTGTDLSLCILVLACRYLPLQLHCHSFIHLMLAVDRIMKYTCKKGDTFYHLPQFTVSNRTTYTLFFSCFKEVCVTQIFTVECPVFWWR